MEADEAEESGATFYPTYREAVKAPVQFLYEGRPGYLGVGSHFTGPRKPRSYGLDDPGIFVKYILVEPDEWGEGVDEEEIFDIIAHEGGHQVLGHEKFYPKDMFGINYCELEASMWALTRRGKLTKGTRDCFINLKDELGDFYEPLIGEIGKHFGTDPKLIKAVLSIPDRGY